MAAFDGPTPVHSSQLGCLFLDFAPPRAFDFDQKLSRNVSQIIFYYHVTKKFLLAWIDWSRTFDFRICFGKILIAFDLDENLTQSVAQVPVWYHVSKGFLFLYFSVGQVLSISDLENGKWRWKSQHNKTYKQIHPNSQQ